MNGMNGRWIAVAGAIILAAVPVLAADPSVLPTATDKESYSAGVEIVRSLMRQGGAINLDAVIQGMKDGITGQELLLSEQELRAALAARQEEIAGGPRHEAIRLGGAASTPVAVGGADLPAMPQKQQSLPQKNDPAGESGQLASANPAGAAVFAATAGSAGSGYAPGVAGGSAGAIPSNAQAKPAAPNGMVLSRRNQARIDVQALKAEMLQRARSGQ